MPPKPPLNWGMLPPTFLLPTSCRSIVPHIQRNAAQITQPTIAHTSVRSIKSTNQPRPDRFAHRPGVPALESTSTAALNRRALKTPRRTGLLATKRGMTAVFNPENGRRFACTVLQLDRNTIMAHKTLDRHGYWAVQVGAGQQEPRNVTKPMLGHFAQAGVSPKRWIEEFRVKNEEGLQVPVGQEVGANWFTVGQWVDVRAMSRGMGFAGGMKRHGFSGQPASHGQSLMHRGMGSAGGSQGSGSRVLPGKRMAGKMGNESVTVKNLQVFLVDEENGILVINGAVPGHKHQLVRIRDAISKPWPEGPMNLAEVVPSKLKMVEMEKVPGTKSSEEDVDEVA
ncbi:mitochondrial 54S ribosomal protein YmL9 [Phaeosphaeriaceae sp. PMI808]|nr:mitochondrial 54S ribosomal protein YmL9 [Phaeosphaeriaceae sp. PMI808]